MLTVHGSGRSFPLKGDISASDVDEFELEALESRVRHADHERADQFALPSGTSQSEGCTVDVDDTDERYEFTDDFGVGVQPRSDVSRSRQEDLLQALAEFGEVFLPESDRGIFEE
jgi:hypothetical protein